MTNVNTAVDFVVEPSLLAGLPASSVAALRDAGDREVHARGARVCPQNGHARHVILVDRGWFGTHYTDQSGAETIWSLVADGGLFGDLSASADAAYDTTLLALDAAGVVYRIDRNTFRALVLRDGRLAAALSNLTVARLLRARGPRADLHLQPAAVRMARVLAEIARPGAGGTSWEIPVPLTVDQLGQLASVKARTAEKVLAELRAAGMITRDARTTTGLRIVDGYLLRRRALLA